MNGVLSALPKPVRFGLFGALGGLLGALLVGEVLWAVLEPPPPPPPPAPSARLALSVSREVGVYQDGKTSFALDFDSDRLEGAPVNVSFNGLPRDVSISSVQGTDRGQREAVVSAADSAPQGTHRVTAVATAVVQGKTVEARSDFEVRIDPLPKPMVDIVFVLDVTSSMGYAIKGVQDGIKSFADGLNPKRVDFRIGLLAFRDRVIGEPSQTLRFGKMDEPFTTDLEEFKRKVSQLQPLGGGDIPESALDAICEAAEYPFRKSTKVLLLITDAPPKLPDKRIRDVSEAADVLKSKNIEQIHIVSNPDERFRGDRRIRNTYEALWSKGGPTGQYFDLEQISAGRDSFNRLLPELSKVIATAAAAARPTEAQLPPPPAKPTLDAAQGLQSSRQYDSSATGQLILAISLWTAAIAAAISVALATGQFLSLNRVPSGSAIGLGLAGGAVAGLVGGAVGQGLFAAVGSGNSIVGVIFRVFGWAALGGLAGTGLAFVVPNLRRMHGLIGGLLGGGLGAIGYLMVSGIGLGDTLGRLAGALVLGFFIGLMVALVEAALRRAWLEVRFGGGEVITVNLGPEPVKVGGDGKQCAVWARGAEPVALRYWLRDGHVVCAETGSGEESVANGDRRTAGSVEVVVRTSSSPAKAGDSRPKAKAKPVSPPPPPPRAEPVSKPQAKPVPPPPPPPPIAAKPASSPISAPKPAAPIPVKPAPKPAGPACPECGASVEKPHGVCPACGAMY
jgi:Mg-chelatase subunit ChlD